MEEWRVQRLEEMQERLEIDDDEVKHSGGEGNAEKGKLRGEKREIKA